MAPPEALAAAVSCAACAARCQLSATCGGILGRLFVAAAASWNAGPGVARVRECFNLVKLVINVEINLDRLFLLLQGLEFVDSGGELRHLRTESDTRLNAATLDFSFSSPRVFSKLAMS